MIPKFKVSLNKALSATAAAVLVVMMFHVVLHAVLRFAADSPIYGTNEVVQYWYLPLVALLGIPAAQLQKQHITVSLLTERMSALTASIFKIFAAGLGIIVSLLWAWFGFEEALQRMAIGATAGVIDITIWPVYFLVPLTFVLLAVLYLSEIITLVRANSSEVGVLAVMPDKNQETSK